MQTELFVPGGYRFIKAVFQYSGGVVAMQGIDSVVRGSSILVASLAEKCKRQVRTSLVPPPRD